MVRECLCTATLVLSTHGLKEIVELNTQTIKAQAGVKLGTLEREARKIGSELRMYPSTFATATLGGFIAGGAGGIGSVTWGTLWDKGLLKIKEHFSPYMDVQVVAFPQDGVSGHEPQALQKALDLGADLISGIR